MTASLRSQRSDGEVKLSEAASHLILPEGIETTEFPIVERKLEILRIPLDEWQRGLLTAILGKRSDGLYAAGVGGAIMSIPRQTGKTHSIGALVFALCLAHPGLLVVWTAHRARTHRQTFEEMAGWASKKLTARYVRNVRRANGEQEIEFNNGSQIMFGARETGFGRGFAKVDVLIFDEAQILTIKAMEDMVPATLVSPNGLVVMAGTPPRESDPGEVFSERRDAALSGRDPDTLYVEFSASEDDDPEDERIWAKANPSFPKRTSRSAILRMKNMLGLDAFRREGLGIWDKKGSTARVFEEDSWGRLVEETPPGGVVSFGVKFTPDGSHVALGGASKHGEIIHVEGLRQMPLSESTDWLVDFLIDRKDTAAQIVVDGKSGAQALAHTLRAARVGAKVLIVPSPDQAVTAHSMFERAVIEGTLRHNGEEELNRQVLGAVRRPIGKAGGFGWAAEFDGDSTALLDAITLAHYGAKTSKRTPGKRQVFL